MFQNETPAARDRRLGKMTKQQKRGVVLFVAIWLGLVVAVMALLGVTVTGVLMALKVQ